MAKTTKAKTVKLSSIKQNPDNPRIIKDDKYQELLKSIKEFPKGMRFRQLVIDADGMLIAGNQRHKILEELGYKEIPAEWVVSAEDLTEKELQRLMVIDNLHAGEWDWEKLGAEWDIAELEDWGLDGIGMDIDAEDLSDTFDLPSAEKSDLEQITFTLSSTQAGFIRDALKVAREQEDFADMSTNGNENSNGNAIAYIVKNWAPAAESQSNEE